MRVAGWEERVLYSAVLLALGAALRERIRSTDAVQDALALRERSDHLHVYRKALIQRLNEVDMSSPFLAAEFVVGAPGDVLLPGGSQSVVLYRISTNCPFCPSNYDFLNDLADGGIPVVGLAADTAADVVRRHHFEWNLRFPVLVGPRGSAADAVPRYGTPTMVAISRGAVVFVEFGELEPEARDALRTLTRGWK